MSEHLPDEPAPSPESFGALYKVLGESPAYRRILAQACGAAPGLYLSVVDTAELRLLATRAALAPGQRVADLGCGMGGPTLLLAAEYGCQMIAVDWSRQGLAVCRRSAQATGLAARVQPVAADISRRIFAEDSLHAVVAIDGFYFGVDLPWLYAEVFRVLRPGGYFAFFFSVPSQAVVDASPPTRRAHRESHRLDHLGALAAAGFINARADDRTAAESRLLARLLDAYTTYFASLAAEIGPELAATLREEMAATQAMSEAGQWPRFLFSARKPGTRPVRRR